MEFYNIPSKDKIYKDEVHKVQNSAHELKKIATWRRQPGHMIFQFNIKTKELKVAKIVEQVAITLSRDVVRNGRICIEKDCIYIEALNRKNAEKHLRREGLI